MLKKKLSSLVSIVALLLSVLVVPLDVLAVESNKIVSSNYRDYNSIIFNDHTVHTADIEGSVAIGGDVITHGGFTYAGSYGNAHNIIGQGSLHEGTPGLVVAGNVNYNSDSLVVVEGGNFIHTDSYQASNKFNMDPNFSMINWSKEQMDALFNSFKADIANEMSLYKSMMTDQTEETIYHKKEAWVSQFDFYESKESDSVLFVDMSAESHDINDIYLPNLDAYDHVIIYSSQPSLKFSRGSIVYKGFSIDTGKPNNDVLFDMASKLTWVLPNATDLRIEGYGLIGDVYAPNASVDTKGGSLNGSLYAENLISAGGFEVHNFRNKPLIPEKTTEPTEPSTTEPSTTEPSTTESSKTELGVVGSSNPKTPNGKSNVSNQKFLPKTGEELTPRMLLIQGLITILGTFLLFYTKKRIEDNPLN